jgi:general secretion pathway protein J
LAQSGFTLVEVLVTLVIVAMVTGVVFGSLQQVFDARARLRPYLDSSEEITRGSDWFRKTVQALLADYQDGEHLFTGSVKDLSGLTASPLLSSPGTPTSFRWQIKLDADADRTVLEYQEAGKTVAILRWTGQEGAFAYYAEDGKWHTSWPPTDTDQGKTLPQLPQLVRLSGKAADSALTIVAAPRASRVAPLPPPPILGERRVQ